MPYAASIIRRRTITYRARPMPIKLDALWNVTRRHDCNPSFLLAKGVNSLANNYTAIGDIPLARFNIQPVVSTSGSASNS
jgi:hypothetical protein